MKKPKSTKTPSVKISKAKVVETVFDDLLSKPAETNKGSRSEIWGLPRPAEIAMVAATLARNTGESPEVLADAAMKIWLAARSRIHKAYERNGEIELQDFDFSISEFEYLQDEERRHSETYPLFYDEEQLPITRDQFLRAVVPKWMKGRPHEQADIAKKYIKDDLRKRYKKEPSDDEVIDAFAKWKSWTDLEAVNKSVKCFQEWYRVYISRTQSEKGKKERKKLEKVL